MLNGSKVPNAFDSDCGGEEGYFRKSLPLYGVSADRRFNPNCLKDDGSSADGREKRDEKKEPFRKGVTDGPETLQTVFRLS